MLLINLISLYLLSVTVAVVFCAVHMRALNGSNYTKASLLLCLAICFYILGYTMELNSYTPVQILFWNYIEYIGIPFVSSLWLTTVLMYTGYFTQHKKILGAAIFVIPLVTLMLRFTNDYHGLYFASVAYVEALGGLFFLKEIGPWMYVQIVHSMLMIIVAMNLFIYDSLKDIPKQAGKIMLVIAASVVAVTGLLLMNFKPYGLPIDYMALCLPLTCIMVILAISRYDLLETKSMARSKVFEASSDAILLVNYQNRILDYNDSAQKLFEQAGIRLENKYLSTLFGKSANLHEVLKKKKTFVLKLRVNGEERYYDISTKNIDDHNMLRGWIKTIRDMTEIYQLNEELKKQAMTDELSVLSNRRAFITRGREWMAKAEESGINLHLLMLDLDHFKDVNDQYGHPTGDLVIREFAQILKRSFDEEGLIARLGGEEFVVLLAGLSDEEVMQKAQKLLTTAEQHVYRYFGNQFHVTVSIGMTKKQNGQSLETLMRKADRALYQSKHRERNCITVL